MAQKIAFLFLTVGDSLRCERLWKEYFHPPEISHLYTIYNHSKHPDRISPNSLLHGKQVSNHISTQWAHNSLVRATVFMLQDALRDPTHSYFVLCSESCVPITTFQEFYNFLTSQTGTLYSQYGPSFFCYNPNYSTTKDCDQRYLRFNNKQWIPQPRFMKADQWFILSRPAAELCATGAHLNDFDRVFASDEHYFINMVEMAGLPFKNRWTTYQDHECDRCHPIEHKELSVRFLTYLRDQGFFFLRKIARNFHYIE